MRSAMTQILVGFCTLLILAGCDQVSQITDSTFHQKFGWKAEDYFTDPKVIALCHAIEADDIPEIDRLAKSGADVNAKGKDNMTPLLWAFPDNKIERFKRLLELGGNPNVITRSDFNTHGKMGRGDSVTHMACRTAFPGYFEAVFAHGGDPNLVGNRILPSETPLFSVMNGSAVNKKAKVRILIDKGADLNHIYGQLATPAMEAAGGGQYDIALMLLEAGANYKIYMPRTNERLIHIVVGESVANQHGLHNRLLTMKS